MRIQISAPAPFNYRQPARVHRTFFLIPALLLFGGGVARSQDGASSYRKPVLVVETEGHHAPVRSLIWPDNATLISTGLDKVVKVWDFADVDVPKLVRTIRPPVWRGPAGILYAAAFSPWKDAKGRQLLAVGGFGVDSTRGDMTVYAFPGKGGAETGEPVARLMPPKDLNASGQRGSVLTIAFDPKFLRFASAGNATVAGGAPVTLWDAGSFTPVRMLKGHTGAIRALAFFPDGRRLVTISADCTMRLWDLGLGLDRDPMIGQYFGKSVLNALAIQPDGAAILVGTEAGEILQFDPANIETPRFQIAPIPLRGPIELLAFRPDGRQLVSSTVISKNDNTVVANYSKVACDVELRNWPSGQFAWSQQLPGLVYAAAFRPDNKALAYSGGIDQAIYVKTLANLQLPPVEIKGKGTTVLDIGFTADSGSVGFSRELVPAATVEGFDLTKRRAFRLSRDALNRAISTFDGWTLKGSIKGFSLELLKGAVTRKLDLDRDVERLCWSSTFIPPGPGHPRPTVAIGTEAGVVVYDLETGQRRRSFAGHGSPVVSLAPSPDGRWLASGSVDQTLMLYPLDGCDRRPGLGAAFVPLSDGRTMVQAVEPRGFAAAMGLLPGDLILSVATTRGGKLKQPDGTQDLQAFIRQANDSVPQLDTNVVRVRRTMPAGPLAGLVYDLPNIGTSKRNSPIFTLLLDVTHEWVMWTPQGYYDTSIAGDTRLLGWQINAPYDQPLANDYLPIATYEATLRRPALLDQLWRLGDLDRALAATAPVEKAPVEISYDDRPPRITLTSVDPAGPLPAPGMIWEVKVPQVRVKVEIAPRGEFGVGKWQALLDQQNLARREVVAPGPLVSEELSVSLTPNRPVRLALQASNTRGNARSESIDLVYLPPPTPRPMPRPVDPPKPEPSPSRLIVVAIGSDKTRVPLLPDLPFAGSDARDLGRFLSGHLLSGARNPGEVKGEDPVVIGSAEATTLKVVGAFDRLAKLLETKQIHPGDSVAVLVEAHAIESPDGLRIALADTTGLKEPKPTIPARDISELLGQLADYGCRVTLFLDVIHETPEKPRGDSFKQWVRELYLKRNVITFVASKEGPSLQDKAAAHGIFALGVLGAFEQLGTTQGIKDRAAGYSLRQFQTAVVDVVSGKSSRRQFAECYVPRSVSQATKFAKP